jgi:hypothetical protein
MNYENCTEWKALVYLNVALYILFPNPQREVVPSIFSSGVLRFSYKLINKIVNPLTSELNPSAQRCLPRFFTGDFNF